MFNLSRVPIIINRFQYVIKRKTGTIVARTIRYYPPMQTSQFPISKNCCGAQQLKLHTGHFLQCRCLKINTGQTKHNPKQSKNTQAQYRYHFLSTQAQQQKREYSNHSSTLLQCCSLVVKYKVAISFLFAGHQQQAGNYYYREIGRHLICESRLTWERRSSRNDQHRPRLDVGQDCYLRYIQYKTGTAY